MDNTRPSVSVLGAGSFGTAMAAAMARTGQVVNLYCRTNEQSQTINNSGQNGRYFPGHPLSSAILATSDLEKCLDCDVIFLAFPAKMMDEYAELIAVKVRTGAVIVNLVKGLHGQHFTFFSLFRERAAQVRYVALKGPTFARPLFLGEWSGLTIGSADPDAINLVRERFTDTPVMFDQSNLPEAIDLVSALKNVYAIVLGLIGSTGPSENTVYLTVTLVMQEMGDILEALGHDRSVLFKFAGVGDTLLTGLCDTSRNRTLGLMMGKGIPIDLVRSDFLAEGVRAVGTLLSHLEGVDAPLLRSVAAILSNQAPPISVIDAFRRR